jgi:site-specific recombinase XerC
MRDLNYALKQLCDRNRDGSHATQHDRERVLDLIASQLQEMGFRQMVVAGLKPKHVEGLVERWKAEGLAIGTIKNRMAELRWWAEKIGKAERRRQGQRSVWYRPTTVRHQHQQGP